MVKIATYGLHSNERNVYDVERVRLVLDTPAYNNSQLISSFHPTSFMSISRVNKVDKRPNGLLIVHIA